MKTEYFELVDIVDITPNSTLKNVYDITVEDDHSFLLSNSIISHNSALSGILSGRNTNLHGAFPLKGKPINVYDMDIKDVMNNAEFKNILTILGLQLGVKVEEVSAGPIWYEVEIEGTKYLVNENDSSITIGGITYTL